MTTTRTAEHTALIAAARTAKTAAEETAAYKALFQYEKAVGIIRVLRDVKA